MLDAAQERLAQVQLKLAEANGDRAEAVKQPGILVEKSSSRLMRTKKLYEIRMTAKSAIAEQERKHQEIMEQLLSAQWEKLK